MVGDFTPLRLKGQEGVDRLLLEFRRPALLVDLEQGVVVAPEPGPPLRFIVLDLIILRKGFRRVKSGHVRPDPVVLLRPGRGLRRLSGPEPGDAGPGAVQVQAGLTDKLPQLFPSGAQPGGGGCALKSVLARRSLLCPANYSSPSG